MTFVVCSAAARDEPEAHADEAQASGSSPAKREVRWRWPRFHAAEYVATAAMLAGSFGLRFGVTWSAEPNFARGILVDDWFYENAYPRDANARKAWKIAADLGYFTSYAWGATEPLIAGIAHDWDVAAQMALINLESYAAYSMVLWGAQFVIRRRRPAERACDGGGGPAEAGNCDDPDNVRAFIGGHTGFVATTASLTCIHHAHMPLYGGGFRDAFPCAYWIAATALVFTSRSVAGDHYLSDNILSLGVGMLAGGVLPWVMHYAHGPKAWTSNQSTPRVGAAMLAPTTDGRGVSLAVGGSW